MKRKGQTGRGWGEGGREEGKGVKEQQNSHSRT